MIHRNRSGSDLIPQRVVLIVKEKPPPWLPTLSGTRCSTQVTPLPALWNMGFRLPSFQRGERWTATMQSAFCDSVFRGEFIPPILLWERRDGTWVIDGQQRLTALGARVVRPDGSTNTPTSSFLDVRSGRFGSGRGRWDLTVVRLARWRVLSIPKPAGRGAREWEWASVAGEIMRKRSLVTYVLGPEATQADAVRAFRAINTPGVLMAPGEVEELIASAV